MTNAKFSALAAKKGFSACYFLPPTAVSTSYKKLIEDPRSVLPEARTVILLIKTYVPAYDSEACEAVISPYYSASHAAYKAAKELALFLSRMGYKALSNVQVPLKKLMALYGIGSMGINSLIAIDGLGSAFHVQAIVTDAEFEFTHSQIQVIALASRCINCGRCMRACPTKAILPGAIIDPNRCLRAVSEMDIIPPEYEEKLHNRILGCDICQSVCPANESLGRGDALCVSLKKLLEGDIEDLKQKIGPNYARVNKLKKKAAVIAANTHRCDLLDDLKRMASSPDASLSQAALRAIERLEENR